MYSKFYSLLLAEARGLSADHSRSAGHEHQAASNWVQGRFERRYTTIVAFGCVKGCVKFATHLTTWRLSSISCIVAQLTVMLDTSTLLQLDTVLEQKYACLSQQYAFSDFFTNSSTFSHVGDLLYPSDI